jgi:hypothetical protein
MTTRSIDVQEVRVPLDNIRKLSPEVRYSYYLLGHMFNEMMTLQKLVGFFVPQLDDKRPLRREPEISQFLVISRIASAKVWEAMLSINQKEVASSLRSVVLPKIKQGNDKLKALNQAIRVASWLAPVRNGIGFHFPEFRKWEAFTTPDEAWVDDVVFVGKMSGNTFYGGSAAIATHWTLEQLGEPDRSKAVNSLISQAVELTVMMTNFLEEVMYAFVTEVLMVTTGRDVGKVIAPTYESVRIPFWTVMKQKVE